MANDPSAQAVVDEAKARSAAEDHKKPVAKAGAMAEVDPQVREVCGAVTRFLVDPKSGYPPISKCLGAMVASRQLYAMAVHDLEIRLDQLTQETRERHVTKAVKAIVEGELLELRMARWFPAAEEDTEAERREAAQIMPHEQEQYEAAAMLFFAEADDDNDDPEENARLFIETALRTDFADIDIEEVWSLMSEVLLQSVLYQASQPFNEEILLTGLKTTIPEWAEKCVAEHTKLDAIEREKLIAEHDTARRERHVPVGVKVYEATEELSLDRTKPVVLAGWQPAVNHLLDLMMRAALASKDAGQLFTVLRLVDQMSDDDVEYRTRQRYLVWVGKKDWEDCTKTVDSWPTIFGTKVLMRMQEPPDLMICDDLALAGTSHGLVGGTAARKAGHAQKRLRDWCKKAGCLLVGGVVYVDQKPAELGSIIGGSEWQQLRDFTTLRAVTTHDEGDDHRIELGNGLFSVTVPKEKLDGNAPSRLILPD